MRAPIPPNEAERLAALHSYDVLDSAPELAFDEITRFASQLCGTPIALVSLVDAARQWFKSRVGLDAQETPRESAFCAHAILHRDVFQLLDATQDLRFADNPLVTSDPYIRFYAGAPLIDPRGNALGTLCVIDRVPRQLEPLQEEGLIVLSHQVLAQLELRRRSKELASQRDELARARDLALSQARARDAFLGKVSRELGTRADTMLRAIRRVVPAVPTPLTADVEQLARSGEGLRAVIDNVLDIARLESGEPQVRLVPIDLTALLSELAEAVTPELARRRLAWSLHCAPDLGTIYSDPARLRQILLHLVHNALKFTSAGRIELRARREQEGGRQRVVFDVLDTGIGIAAHKLSQLFRDFTRFHDGADDPGAGLGLALGQRLARLLGGVISARSEPGRGSCFTLRVPG